MKKAVIIHKDDEEERDSLGFVCIKCYDEKMHKKFAVCDHDPPLDCDRCKRTIGWEEDEIPTNPCNKKPKG